MVDPRDAPPADRATKTVVSERRPAPRTVYSLSEEETHALGRTVARSFKGGELVLLEGDLGLGKTVFARGIAEGLGIAPEDVSSPSFTLVQEYRGGHTPMFHVDLYRLEEDDEIETLGLEDFLSSGGVVVVEWGDRLGLHYRHGALIVRLRSVLPTRSLWIRRAWHGSWSR